MEQYDPIVKKSGCISRHMAIQFYIISKELDSLEVSNAHSEEFLPFFNWINNHKSQDRHKLCGKLPGFFFTESKK